MGITVNGTIIPENAASALSINGVNITDVILNGTNVWHQSLGPVYGWSGSSGVFTGMFPHGIQTSGFLAQQVGFFAAAGWVSVDGSGIFTQLTAGTLRGINNTLYYSGGTGIITFSNKIFTGTSNLHFGSVGRIILKTSGNALLYGYDGSNDGANYTYYNWISLT